MTPKQKPDPAPEPTPPEARQDAPDGPESDSSPTPADDSQAASLRREAADRRRQLREVEQERDQLRARVDAHDRAEVEALAAERMADGRDLWLSTELDDLRGDDGMIDAEKVSERVTALLDERPHWRKAEPDLDTHAGARTPAPEPQRSPLGQAMKKALRGD